MGLNSPGRESACLPGKRREESPAWLAGGRWAGEPSRRPGGRGCSQSRSPLLGDAWAGGTPPETAPAGRTPPARTERTGREPQHESGKHEWEDEQTTTVQAPGLGSGTPAPRTLACSRADGTRARDEPKPARHARQPRPGALEGPAAPVHRAPLPEELRPGTPRGRRLDRAASTTGREQERPSARPRRPHNAPRPPRKTTHPAQPDTKRALRSKLPPVRRAPPNA